MGVDEVNAVRELPCSTPPGITPPDLPSVFVFLGPLARPDGIIETNPDLALPLVFLVLTGLDPLDLLSECLEDLSDISDDGLLLVLDRFDLSLVLVLFPSLGLAPVSLPVSLETLSRRACSAESVDALLVEFASAVEADASAFETGAGASPEDRLDDDPLSVPSTDSLLELELVLPLDPLLESEP